MTVWRMRIAYCVLKVTNTLSKYVILTALFTTTMVAQARLNVTLYVIACIVVSLGNDDS